MNISYLNALTQIQVLFFGIVMTLVFASAVGYSLRFKFASNKPSPSIENLIDRVNAWWVMVMMLAFAFAFGKPGVVIMFAIISFFALREFITLTATRQGDYWALVVSFYVVLPLQYWFIWTDWYGMYTIFVPVYAFLLLPILASIAEDTRQFLERAAKIQWGLMISVFCISYIPALLTIDVKGFEDNILLVAFLILVVQVSDVMQYVWGKLLGKHLIAPTLSPSKTVEGFVGGVLSASLLGCALYPITPFTPVKAFFMALMICLLGFLGGLVMSAIKRDRHIKDWGHLISGHGGILDRMDSLCFAAPVFFHFIRYYWV